MRSEREYDLNIATAWHTAHMSNAAQVGKLKGLSHYLTKKRAAKRSISADALHFFHGLRARGFDVKIERVVH